MRSALANQGLRTLKGLTNNDDLDFDSTWGVLSSSLREIHTKNASNLSFEQLYRNAYKLVLKKKGDALYDKVKAFERDWLLYEVQPQILVVLSACLFASGSGSSATTNTNEQRIAGEKLMKALKQAWEDHNLCMNMTTDVLMYMVYYLKLYVEADPGSTDVLTVLGSRLLYRQPKTVDIYRIYGSIPRLCPSGSYSNG